MEPRLYANPKRLKYSGGNITDATSYNLQIDKTYIVFAFIFITCTSQQG